MGPTSIHTTPQHAQVTKKRSMATPAPCAATTVTASHARRVQTPVPYSSESPSPSCPPYFSRHSPSSRRRSRHRQVRQGQDQSDQHIPQQHRRPRRHHAWSLLLFVLATSIFSSLSLGAEAAVFEVIVERPATSFDPPSSATLRTANSSDLEGGLNLNLGEGTFMSKYLGNSVVTNARNLGYAGTITLGEPPQSFQVVFDTGSDMIVVTSNMCQGTHCNDMTHYTCTSCSRTPYSYNITYGDGTWGAGPIVTDTVSIGGLVIKNQQILDITQSGLDLSAYGNGVSGLVGLMPLSPVAKAITPLQTIYENKLLDQNVFSVYLTSSLAPKQGGSFLFGGIDTSKFTGELNYIPLSTAPTVREGMWYIDADNALAGSTPIPGYKKSPWLFDTGTSFIAVPTSFADAFHKLVPGAAYSPTDQVYTLPCTGNTSFAVSFQGIVYEVPYLDYIARASGSDVCVSLVMPLGNYEMYILGDPFLRQVYAVYDFNTGASRIGLAKVNVKNTSLGNEGLSGDPVPGGGIIGPQTNAAAGALSNVVKSLSATLLAMSILLSLFI